MISTLYLALAGIAAVASIIGAIFAAWRWDYARRAFDYQKKQIYLQILMLAESREYWRTPKMAYVKRKEIYKANIDKEIKHILKEFNNVK